MYKCRQKQDAESGQGFIHGVFWKGYVILANKYFEHGLTYFKIGFKSPQNGI
jgi:hypothetical protein